MSVAVRCIKSQILPSPVQTALTGYRSTFCKSLNSREMSHLLEVIARSQKEIEIQLTYRKQQETTQQHQQTEPRVS